MTGRLTRAFHETPVWFRLFTILAVGWNALMGISYVLPAFIGFWTVPLFLVVLGLTAFLLTWAEK